MNFDHKASKVLITGKSGSGKTSFWLDLLVASKARWRFVFDPDREASTKLRLPALTTLPALEAAAARGGWIVFDPAEMFAGDFCGAFAWYSLWVLKVSKLFKGPKLLAVDEVQKWTRPAPALLPTGFQQLLDVGRREELDLLIISQRPNQVHDAIRAQLTQIVTFAHTDRLPLHWLEQDGFDPAAVSALRLPDKARGLAPQWLKKNLVTGEVERSCCETHEKRDASAARRGVGKKA